MGIPDISCELCLMIAEYLPIKDLNNFLLTCRGLSSLLTPRLHKLGVQDVGRLTALQWAARHGHIPLIKLAISRGAYVDEPIRLSTNKADGGGGGEDSRAEPRTALYLALYHRHDEAFKVLLELGASTKYTSGLDTAAHTSAYHGDIDSVRAYVAAGFGLDTRGSKYQTILHEASASGRVEMMQYLLAQEGAREVINARDNLNHRPLHYAMFDSRGDKVETVKMLLQHGAEIRTKYPNGSTPAHVLARRGDVDVMRLIVAGVDFDARGYNGRTILHDAVIGGGEKMVEFLLEQEGDSQHCHCILQSVVLRGGE